MEAENGDRAVDHGISDWGATKSQEEATKDPCLEPSEGIWPCKHLDFRLLPPELERIIFYCFKLLDLQSSALAGLED